MEIWTGFTLGLLSGFHCIGMCGPIAMAVPVDRRSVFSKWLSFFLYNFGRVFTYGLLGFLFGLVGRVFKINGLQQWLSIFLGIAIIVTILAPKIIGKNIPFTNFFLPYFNRFKLLFSNQFKNKSLRSIATIGALNGLLPCGMVYIGLTVATASGSAWSGTFYMMAFGLGTIPLMLGAQWAGSFIKAKSRGKIRRLVPVFVFLIGAIMILRGLNLGIPYLSPNLQVKGGYIKACH